MNLTILVALIAGSFTVSVFLTRRFSDPHSVAYMLDYPNERSLHDHPIPRSGGLAILLAIILGGTIVAMFQAVDGLPAMAACLLVVAGLGFWDDRYSVSPFYRLLGHTVVAVIIVYSGVIPESLDWFGTKVINSQIGIWFFAILFIVWMINLYNFMDGMDGLAGGMAVIGFGSLAVIGGLNEHILFTAICSIIAASACGFLLFNFPPARIFMGDTGSSTLGLLAAISALWGIRDNVFPIWVPVLIFSPFIADTSVTLIRRLYRRERIWHAHKTHYYQQLALSGWGHRKTVLVEYLIMLGCGITAVICLHVSALLQTILIVGWALFYAVFFFWVSNITTQRRLHT